MKSCFFQILSYRFLSCRSQCPLTSLLLLLALWKAGDLLLLFFQFWFQNHAHIFIWLTIFTYSALIIHLWLYFTFTLVGQSEEVIYIWKGAVANIACFNPKGPYNGGKIVMYTGDQKFWIIPFCFVCFWKKILFFETFRFDHLADAFTQRDLKWGQ